LARLGFSQTAHVKDHIVQFRSLGGFSKNTCYAFYLKWLSSVWIIWHDRNARVFQHKEDIID